MAIYAAKSRAPCPLFAGRGLTKSGFTLALPHKTYLSCDPVNIDQEKDTLGVYCYDVADRVYNDGEDSAVFGIYAESGSNTDQITDAKHMYALDVFFKLTEDYTVASGEWHNADVRAARIQCRTAGSLSGVAHGMYLALRMTGGETLSGYYLAYAQSYGGIGLEVRTESLSGGTLTVGDGTNYGLVGILVAHKNDVAMQGNYYGIVLHEPLETGAFGDSSYGIAFQDAALWAGTAFDVGIDFEDSVVKAINIDGCTMALDADVTITAATNAVNINVTSTGAISTGYIQALQLTVQHSTGDLTGDAEMHVLALDTKMTGGGSIGALYWYAQTIYMYQASNPVISGYAAALSVYIDNLGDACADLMVLDLQQALGSALTGGTRSTYIRMRRQSSVSLKCALRLEASSCTNLLSFDDGNAVPISPSAGTTLTNTHKIAIDINGTIRYIAVGTIA